MKINWEKSDGLLAAIVQDSKTKQVLMLGYMNEESYNQTLKSNLVCFFSRSRKKLWTKGETSGAYLDLVDINIDCDNDTFLVQAIPRGPVCHLGTTTCFENKTSETFLSRQQMNPTGYSFLQQLDEIIKSRLLEQNEKSYISKLQSQGIDRIIQKVGEEAIETVISAKNENNDHLIDESADLVFHLMVLLASKKTSLEKVVDKLQQRHLKK